MYINKLSLRNFKCFEKVEVSFSKITLLTGPNSSGKSSLIYGFLGPLQTETFPFYLSPNGKYVNMGDYKEMVFNNINKRNIGIDMEILGKDRRNDRTLLTDWSFDKKTMMPKLQYLNFSMPIISFEISKKDIGSYILKLNYNPELSKESMKKDSFIKLVKFIDSFIKEFQAQVPDKEMDKFKSLPHDFLKPRQIKRGRKFSSLEEIQRRFPIIYLVSLPYLPLMERNINFISSFRIPPERTYYQKSKSEEKVGKHGDNCIDQILEWEKKKTTEFQELKSILKKLKLLYSLKTKQLPGGRFEFRVKVQRGSIWALLPEVGFGISQFLPVVVADLQLPSNSTLFLAQPEIHLHPSAQAALADYLIEQIGKKRKRYVVETHSEYLLNRVRLAIVKGSLKPDDVSVYYFENSTHGTKTYPIMFTKDGKIENAPKSFFNTYMMDLMDIALNAK